LVNPIEAPGWIVLRHISSHDAIFFYELDAKVFTQTFSISFRHFDGETVDSVLKDVLEFALVGASHIRGNVLGD